MRTRTVVVITLAMIPALTQCFGSQPQPTRGTANAVQALAADVARHPQAEAEDIYKFLHQAMFGPGHAIPDPTAAEEYLQRELEGLGPPAVIEARCNTLGGDPVLVRVNLRPFVDAGFDAETLLESFVATANEIHGDPTQMRVALELVVDWLTTVGQQVMAETLTSLDKEFEKQGYPAIHHSSGYETAYQPAYRVVAASAAASHGWCGSTF